MTGLPNVAARVEGRAALCADSIHPAAAWYREDAPVLAAALVEVADALEEIAEPGCELVGPPETCLTGGYEDRCAPCWAEFALARLVAFDASLKETT